MQRLARGTVLVFMLGIAPGLDAAEQRERAQVVLLGTGTPIPDPSSSGPAVAVVVSGQSYLFDAGAGVVRQAQAAAQKLGLPALDAKNLTRLFVTHLHSDHTLGYADVMLTPWLAGRVDPLEVYGPLGTAAMTEYLKTAYSAETKRTEGAGRQSPEIRVHEIATPGEVYRDSNVVVTALSVPHGSWPQAFGYAVHAGERSIVISGDTAPSDEIVKACRGCDVLVHEVYSADRFKIMFGPEQGAYHTAFHTSTKQLADIAGRAKPKLLVLYHQLYFAPRDQVDLVKEIRRTYSGEVVNGRDLTAY